MKFCNDTLAERLYGENADAEEGSSCEAGWYGLYRGPFEEDDTLAGVILYESTDGFVDIARYESPEALEKDWAEIEAEQAVTEEDEPNEDGGDYTTNDHVRRREKKGA